MGYFLGLGLPVVGTPKAARGYAAPPGTPGLQAVGDVAALAPAALRLHGVGVPPSEAARGWAAASLSALAHSAALDDARAGGEDLRELAVQMAPI